MEFRERTDETTTEDFCSQSKKQKRLFGNMSDLNRESDNITEGKGVGYLAEKLEV